MSQALFQTKNVIQKRPSTETQRPRAITITSFATTAPIEPEPTKRTISFSNPLNLAIDMIQSQSSPTSPTPTLR